MTKLNSKKILEENNATEASSISNLTLTHRALSDVSCLGEFGNLERLDIGFNNLTTIEGLKSCVNLKWLSVLQNKLQSLEGIQGLTKLTVLNAGKNKLKAMDGIRSLVSLRALILNDNEITAICNLDQMKELNTLVLSRNPVSKIGNSLVKTKSLAKLSLSNCQLQTIGSSLTSCPELKELRLAHNEIKALPVELSRNARLLNLDLGNNLITNVSDLKVLTSLVNLRNLNLQGNPIAEKDTLVKKIKKLVPNLQIFNARPTEKTIRKDRQRDDGSLMGVDKSVDHNNKVLGSPTTGEKNSKKNFWSDEEDANALCSAENGAEKKRKTAKLESEEDEIAGDSKSPSLDAAVLQKDLKSKKQKKEKLPTSTASVREEEEDTISRKGDKKSKKKSKQNAGSIIDDAEAPFAELFATNAAEDDINRDRDQNPATKSVRDVDSAGGFVTNLKKKKNRGRGVRASITDLSAVDEVGLGGPSTWD